MWISPSTDALALATMGASSVSGNLSTLVLILSIWAITQHYADFDAQIRVLVPEEASGWDAANANVETLFRKLLTPETTSA